MNAVNLIRYEDVYYVEAGSESTFNPIAIRPTIYKDFVRWEDTSRGTIVSLVEIELEPKDAITSPQKITIKAENGDTIILWQLNLKLYNEKVKNLVYKGPEFKSDEELKKFYLINDFHEYS